MKNKDLSNIFSTREMLKDLMWTLLVFLIAWAPCTLIRAAIEYLVQPAYNYNMIHKWLWPSPWWWFLALIFWSILLLEKASSFSFFYPSKEYQLNFPKWQIVTYWMFFIAWLTVPPYLFGVIGNIFSDKISMLLMYIIWMPLTLLTMNTTIRTGEGLCILLFARPFQDKKQPGLNFVFQIWIASLLSENARRILAKIIMPLKIDTTTKTLKTEIKQKIFVNIGTEITETNARFSYWWYVKNYGSFLRKIRSHKLIDSYISGTAIFQPDKKIQGLTAIALKQSVDKTLLDLTEVEIINIELNEALVQKKGKAEIKRLKLEFHEEKEKAVNEYLEKIQRLASGKLAGFGIDYQFFMNWDYPETYSKAQERKASVKAAAETDQHYAETQMEAFDSPKNKKRRKDGKQEGYGLTARVAGLALSLVNKISGDKKS